jgi:hypothetical protein
MCTTDCYCYEGTGGKVRRDWENLGDDWFKKFNRTALPSMYFKVENDIKIPLYPLKWTKNETLAKKNFK